MTSPPPKVNQSITVQTDEVDAVLRSRVEESSETRLLIAHPSDGTTSYQFPRGVALVIEWITDRGLCRVPGIVVGQSDVGVAALAVDLLGEVELFQRRQYARAELALDLAVWADPRGEPVEGVTLDISGGGVRAAVPVQLSEGSLVRIEIDMPSGKSIPALARVVAQREDGVVAFDFHEIVPGDRELLVRTVFASFRADATV
jgi:c-di-GMP-binding flagellar brake protein YcgR